MTDPIRLSHTGLNAEDRLAELSKWTKHTTWKEYVQYHERNHDGQNPMDAAVQDIAWLAKNQDWDERGDRDRSAHFIHPRYGRVMGQRTFYPFPDWLYHNDLDLKNRGIEVVLRYSNGSVRNNMDSARELKPSPL